MDLDDRTLPVTRRQLDIWLAQEANHSGASGAEWQLGLFAKIHGAVELEALEWAIRRVAREAEPLRAAFFEVDGQVFRRALDYPEWMARCSGGHSTTRMSSWRTSTSVARMILCGWPARSRRRYSVRRC